MSGQYKQGVDRFSCYLVGEDHLIIDCANILLKDEHLIRGIISPNPEVKEWALQNNINFFESVESAKLVLLNSTFDYLFSIVNSKILSAAVLNSPQQFTINYHNAPLPRYAGLNANCWAIVNAEKTHGVTWHVMTEDIDAGDILKQELFSIDEHETALSLNLKCYNYAIKAFEQLVNDLATFSYNRVSQDLAERIYYNGKKRIPGNAWVDWRFPAEEIECLCRALNWGDYANPLGLAKFNIENQVFVIDKLEILTRKSRKKPGTLLEVNTEILNIATATFDIRIKKISSLNGYVWDIKALCQHFRLKIGTCLPLPAPYLYKMLENISTENFKHQTYWIQSLKKFKPATLPFLPHDLKKVEKKIEYKNLFSIEIPESNYKDLLDFLPTPINPSNIALAILLIYLYRLGNRDNLGIGFGYDALKKLTSELFPFVADSVPLFIQLNDSMGFDQVLKITMQQFELLETHGTYCRDIIRCYPKLALYPHQSPIEIIFTNKILDKYHFSASIIFAISLDGRKFQLLADKRLIKEEPDLQVTLNNFPGHLKNLIESVVNNKKKSIMQLALLTVEERKKILVNWNQTQKSYTSDKSIPKIFEEQATQAPKNIAVVYNNERLSYEELNQKANQLARFLLRQGIKPGQLIGICMERGINTIISILAILKTGAIYIPIDPKYPRKYLQFIFKDINASIILTNNGLKNHIENCVNVRGNIKIISVNSEQNIIDQEISDNLTDIIVQADQPAHIIYTSGSTGQPKGVIIPHRAVIRLVKNSSFFEINLQDSMAHISNISFDAATCEIWGPLLNGARLVCGNNATLLDANKFADFLQSESITLLLITTGLFNQYVFQYPAMFRQLKYLIICGEVLHSDKVELLLNCHEGHPTYIINGYGPAENTACTSAFRIIPQERLKASVPIGKPITNTTVYVLDEYLNPLPIGAAGELFTGGDGLALGYLNRPEFTATKFIHNPFSTDPNARLYRTGDIVRWLPDGNLDYLGRMDNQIKIRGFRVELESIQASLLQCADIIQATITVYEDKEGSKCLIAYLVPQNGSKFKSTKIRQFLRDRLPAYMVPSLFISLPQLPLNANGKVDIKALPIPNFRQRFLENEFIKPTSFLERNLLAIWTDLLSVDGIGINDNFFELGGHSLLITRLILELKQQFNLDIALHDFLEQPTIAHLARLLTKERPMAVETKNFSLIDDTILDPNINTLFTAMGNSTSKAILLTGVTGFLGIHLLSDLSRSTSDKIYCLVRGKNVFEGQLRIKSALKKYGLLIPDMERVIPLIGDLSKPLLGLSEDTFSMLAENIDSIYHNGAYVHHLYNYEILRASNVFSTITLLKLAATKQIKKIHYISTLSSLIDHTDNNGQIIEDFLIPNSLPNKSLNGYGLTKWASESLLAQAYQRGIPIKIYRPGWIMGAFNKKVGPAENNHLYLLINGCIEMGYAPDWDMQLNMLPVNFVSKAIIDISISEQIQTNIFNLSNPKTISWRSLIKYIKEYQNKPIILVSPEEWSTKYLPEINKDNSLFSLLSLYLKATDDNNYISMQNQMSHVNTSNTNQALADLNIDYPLESYARMIDYYFNFQYKELQYAK